MSENKKLMYWLLGIFSATFLLVVGVMAHDRQIDKCIVDHLFDFHFDPDHVIEEHEKDKINKSVEQKMQQDSERRQREWANEVRGGWSGQEGTSSGNDSKDCNRDR